MATVAALLLIAAPATADILVSNVDRTTNATTVIVLGKSGTRQVRHVYIGFQTGGHHQGYDLAEILVKVDGGNANDITAGLYTTASHNDNRPRPGSLVTGLSEPAITGAGTYAFGVPAGTLLDPNTRYGIRLSKSSDGEISLAVPSGTGRDPACIGGWQLENESAQHLQIGNLQGAWGFTNRAQVRVHGHAVGTRRPMDWDRSTLGPTGYNPNNPEPEVRRSFEEGDSKKFAFELTNSLCFYDRDDEAEIEVAFASQKNGATSTDDYTVSVNAQVLQPTMKAIRGPQNAFTGSHPHYRIPFAAGAERVEVVVTATDDDNPEGQETMFLRAYDGDHRFEDDDPTSLYIRANDQYPTIESATFGTQSAELHFNAPVQERTLTGNEQGSTLRTGLYFGIYDSETKPRMRRGAPTITPSQYAETVTFHGNSRVDLVFEEPLDPDTRQWLIYDRLGVYSPLQGAGGEFSGPVQDFVVEVLNPDTGASDPAMIIDDASGTEGTDTEIEFTVRLNKESNADVTVDYETNNGTATAGDDFRSASGTLTFSPGTTEQTITVGIIDDDVEDSDEEFTVKLDNASGATIADDTATGTIYNDESDVEQEALTAAFEDVPSEHDGENAFTLTLRFSAEIGASYKTLRDEAFTVEEGTVTRARRVDGRQDLWTIHVEPDGRDAVTITLPGNRDCDATGAVCTRGDDPQPLTNSPSATVDGPPSEPLTASFSGMPDEHDGGAFTFDLTFSEDLKDGFSFRALRDHAFSVSGGETSKARRVAGSGNQEWTITVEPDGNGTVTIELPATSDCSAEHAICTEDGRALSESVSDSVAGPVGIAVADAKVTEAAGAVLSFAVSLTRAPSADVTIDYATSNGSAQAGADYTAASGTLTISSGSTSGTIDVAVLDDSHDDADETMTLTLSNPSSGVLSDATATGTIENRDALPKALIARFGRTAAVHVVEQVEQRVNAPRRPGFDGRLAGRQLRKGMERDFALSFLQQFAGGRRQYAPDGQAGYGHHASAASMTPATTGHQGMPGTGTGPAGSGPMMSMTGTPRTGAGQHGDPHRPGLLDMGLGNNLMTGSEFALNRETGGDGTLSFWSRSARSSFYGREGAMAVDGDVRTTMFGADYAKGRMVTGVSLSHSRGLGGYSGVDSGQMTSAVTGLYPWIGYKASERVTVWTVAGYGAGGLMLNPGAGAPIETGLSMAMAAGGGRGELLGNGEGFALAVKADALWVGTRTQAANGTGGKLKATSAAVNRVRTAIEGSQKMTLGRRMALSPSVEIGIRQDGGDAERGRGMDLGAGLVLADGVTGLAVDIRVRRLLVHQAEGFAEHGMAISVSYNPTPSTPLGFSALVSPAWGGDAMSGAEALWGRESMGGMGQDHLLGGGGSRLDTEIGYGVPIGARFVGTPRVGLRTSEYGRDYRIGYAVSALEQGAINLQLGIDAERRESPRLYGGGQARERSGADQRVIGTASLGW